MNIKYILLFFIFITNNNYSQIVENTSDINEKNIKINLEEKKLSKIIELDKIVKGIGPAGHYSIGIASRDLISKEELKGYPQMKNLPDSLTNMKEYLFMLDDFQFYYQNYKQGVYSKDFFIKKAKGNGRKLKDTILLSDKKVKNTISIVAGYALDSTIVYIVDTNNNNDYSDELPKKILSNVMKQEDIVNNSETVDIEYFDGESIKKDRQLIMVGNSRRSKKLSLNFKFPQYRYGKVKIENENYLIIAQSASFNQSIYLVKDQPYFDRLDKKYMVNPSQYLKIGNTYVQYFPISQNLNKIELKISPTELDSNKIPVSNQVGMIAPSISGVDILNKTQVSTEKLKGKYMFLDFWSTSCPPCIKEFPKIKEVYDTFSHDAITIIGIADIRGKINAKEFLVDKNVTWLNINGKSPSTVMSGYNINSYPTTYLIDPNGKIIATNLRGDDLKNKLELLKVSKKEK